MMRLRLPVVAVVAALVLAGCSAGEKGQTAEVAAPTAVPGDPLAVPDPAPVPTGADTPVGPDGATATVGAAEFVVPVGAVPAGQEFTVLGLETIPAQPGEVFGQPVGLEHDVPLAAPVTVTWQLPDLDEAQLSGLLLVKWDPDLQVWTPRPDVPVTVADGTLVAQLDEFSFWDWVAGVGQTIGEVAGARKDAPRCSGAALPSWVRGTVDPDEGTTAAAIRVCFEPDSRDGIVTTRVVGNRTFTQRLTMVDGGQSWAWTYPGPEEFDLPAAVLTGARAVFDSPTSYLVPALGEVAVGIGRPARPGPVQITAEAGVDWVTVAVDVVAFALQQAGGVGADANPSFEALAQTVLECGGDELLGRPDFSDVAEALRTVVGVVASCAGDVRSNGATLQRFEELSRAAIARGGLSSSVAVKANRLAYGAAGAVKVLTAGEMAFYASDQLQNSVVGDLSLSVRGDGTPQQLGAWTPSCSSTDTDAGLLYDNVAFQDEFADQSKELWQFPGWAAAAAAAVTPLQACSSSYRERLADALPTSWGDAKAAEVVAEAVRALGGGDADPLVVRFDGIGAVSLSLTADDLLARGYTNEGNLYEGKDASCVRYAAPDGGPGASVESATGRVLAISNSAGEEARTQVGGIGVGATLGEVRAAFAGYSITTFLDYDFGQGTNGVVVSDGSGAIGLSLDGDDDSAVVSYVNGVGIPGSGPSNAEDGC